MTERPSTTRCYWRSDKERKHFQGLRCKQIPDPAQSEREAELKPTGYTQALRSHEHKRLGIAATTVPGRRKSFDQAIECGPSPVFFFTNSIVSDSQPSFRQRARHRKQEQCWSRCVRHDSFHLLFHTLEPMLPITSRTVFPI